MTLPIELLGIGPESMKEDVLKVFGPPTSKSRDQQDETWIWDFAEGVLWIAATFEVGDKRVWNIESSCPPWKLNELDKGRTALGMKSLSDRLLASIGLPLQEVADRFGLEIEDLPMWELIGKAYELPGGVGLLEFLWDEKDRCVAVKIFFDHDPVQEWARDSVAVQQGVEEVKKYASFFDIALGQSLAVIEEKFGGPDRITHNSACYISDLASVAFGSANDGHGTLNEMTISTIAGLAAWQEDRPTLERRGFIGPQMDFIGSLSGDIERRFGSPSSIESGSLSYNFETWEGRSVQMDFELGEGPDRDRVVRVAVFFTGEPD